ncbi:MAG: rod shape-determining protein MreC [Acidimicrobiales bacterium]
MTPRHVGGSGRSRSTIIVLALASISLLTLDLQGVGIVDGVRDGARTVFGPVESAADAVVDPFRDAWNGAFSYDDLEAENDRLRAQLEEIAGDEVALDEVTAQYEALQEEVDLSPPRGFRAVAARVISQPSSNFDRTIEIDVGSSSGVGEGMPVVTGSGLAGRVLRSSSDRSVVRLGNDIEFAVGVRLVETRDVALARGQGEGKPLIIDNGLEANSEIEAGENVVTNGGARSAFPSGVPVGKVTSVERDQLGIPTVEVDLIVELSRLSFVSVLVPEDGG